MKGKTMHFTMHVPNFLKEISDNALGPVGSSSGKSKGFNQNNGVLFVPLNQLRLFLLEVADRAVELKDPKLLSLMCDMTLLEEANPESKSYDKKMVDNVRKLAGNYRKY